MNSRQFERFGTSMLWESTIFYAMNGHHFERAENVNEIEKFGIFEASTWNLGMSGDARSSLGKL